MSNIMDIRNDNEQFFIQGKKLKELIFVKIKTVLQPALDSSIEELSEYFEEPEEPQQLASLFVAVLTTPIEELSSVPVAMITLAKSIRSLSDEIRDLSTIATCMNDDIAYVLDIAQLNKYGVAGL